MKKINQCNVTVSTAMMVERKFKVLVNDKVVAENMTLKIAKMLVKTLLFDGEFTDYETAISIREM